MMTRGEEMGGNEGCKPRCATPAHITRGEKTVTKKGMGKKQSGCRGEEAPEARTEEWE